MEGTVGLGDDKAAPSGHLLHMQILRPRPPPADAGGGAQRTGDSNTHSSEKTLVQRKKATVDPTEVSRRQTAVGEREKRGGESQAG